jgi:hypothetical protein
MIWHYDMISGEALDEPPSGAPAAKAPYDCYAPKPRLMTLCEATARHSPSLPHQARGAVIAACALPTDPE